MATEFTFNDGSEASAPSVIDDSYCTTAYAQSYFNSRLGTSAWDDASENDKTVSLIMSTRLIERLNYIGEKAEDNQDMQFPRGDDTIVPVDIKFACCEIALRLLDGVDPELEYESLRMTSQKYSEVGISYDKSNIQDHILAGIPSIEAWRHLLPYIRDSRTIRLEKVS